MAPAANTTVLHYTGANDDRGGIMSVVHALAAAGAFDCIVGASSGYVSRRREKLPVLEFPPIAAESIGPRTWWRARTVARAVRAWLRAEPNRILHAHSRAGLLTALHLAAGGEKKVAVSVHCYGRQRWFYRYAARRLGSRLYWLTPAMKRYYGIGAAAAADWTQCVPSCIALHDGGRRKQRRERGAALHLGGVGMLVRWKGWHWVLEALAGLKPELRERVRFTHVGSEVDSTESHAYGAGLRRRGRELGLENCVTWRGEQDSAAELMGEIDALVVPSIAEPFSVAMLEALRGGVPVIASRAGGPSDVLQPPRNGWFFEPENSDDLARVLTTLMETDALERVEINAKDLEPFSAERVAAQWSAIYTSILREA